jgi:glycyl-tRNA synthetase
MPVGMDKVVNLCKRRGFIFQSSEIYGGQESCWDYGPLGAELKRNVKAAWWRDMVQRRPDMVGLDASILMNPRVWKASGHVDNFSDPMVDCKKCKKRFRADHLPSARPDAQTQARSEKKAEKCPSCGGELTEPRNFNLMFKTFMGPVEDSSAVVYMRPETAQGIFVNFENVQQTMRKKLPFGIGQIGKAFRNEITPGNFTFRTREFEQMEIEYFVKPGADEEAHRMWLDVRLGWYAKYGMKKENLKLREHAKSELAHYAKGCYDIEYLFPMGWSELEGIANRTDFDLKAHAQHSGKALSYFEEDTKTHIVPYVIEPSAGADRGTLAFLIDAYEEQPVKDETRTVLHFHPALAPVKVAILPLKKNEQRIVDQAKALAETLRADHTVWYDDTGAIGKLYRRQDEIGTPYCVTIDFQTLEDGTATVRERDSMAQERVAVKEMPEYFAEKLRW